MHRLYDDLAPWWPLLSPPAHYVEEAADLRARLAQHATRPGHTLLELGSGGGSLAHQLAAHYTLTLTDLSQSMLDVSRQINPTCEHVAGDMRTLRLGRQFDVVLLHDAVMYMLNRADLAAALTTAAVHAAPGALLAILPDAVRETFEPDTSHDGLDAADGRGLRYLAWTWDQDPHDEAFDVAYTLLLRAADGTVRCEHEVHREGLFARAVWCQLIEAAGFDLLSVERDPWAREVFLARRKH